MTESRHLPPAGSRGVHTKTYVLIALAVLLGSFGNVFLSAGMKQIGAVNDWSPAALAGQFLSTFTNGIIWLGILCLLLFFVCYLLVLSWADFSYVLPATASSYAVVPLLGYAFLGEHVPPLRWVGVVLICFGVALVGQTPPRTTEQN